MCDVAYVYLLDSVERRTVAAQAAVLGAACAAGVTDLPDVTGADQDAFDAALAAEPAPESRSVALLRELGVA